MNVRFLFLAFVFTTPALRSMEPPKLLDPALRLEALCSAPDIEAPTTVVGAPDGSFYVGCDPRDARLNTDKPECYIVRFSSMGAEKKRTVFAGKIYSPAGSAWHDGWLYVAHDPFLTRFRDTDGDGIADVREDLITNLGKRPDTGLNDHCASGFTLGMDGFFYMSIGDRGTFQTRSVKDGSTISLQGGGIIRFRPDGTALEIFSTGTRNHLAVCLDAEDNAFTLDNTDDGNGWWTRLTHHIEGGYYGYPYDYQKAVNYGVMKPSTQTLDAVVHNGGTAVKDGVWVQADREKPGDPLPDPSTRFPLNFLPAMTDFGGGSPTGGLCYLSDGLPEKYRGRLLFSEWGKGGLFVIEVARDGATFRFVKNTPLIQGGHGSDFRPMQLSVAADGSLLIADWQWGGWKGPKTTGTIWRLSWPEAQPAPRLKDESKATVEELLAALGHVDRDQRLRAEAALVKRMAADLSANSHVGVWGWAKEAAPLRDAVLAPDRPFIQRLHVLGTMRQLHRLEDAAITKITLTQGGFSGNGAREMGGVFLSLQSDPVMRLQAVRASGHSAMFILLKSIPAEAPTVRLEAAVALARQTTFSTDYQLFFGDADAWVRFSALTKIREHIASGRASAQGGNDWIEATKVVGLALRSKDAAIRETAWSFFPDSQVIHAAGNEQEYTKRVTRLGTVLREIVETIS